MMIKKPQSYLKLIFFTLFCMVIVIETNATLKDITSVRYTLILLDLGVVFLHCLFCRRVNFSKYIIWAVCILGFSLVSAMWSIDAGHTVQNCKNLLITLLICSMSTVMVEEERDYRMLWNAVLLAFIINSVYVLYAIGISHVGEFRIGADYEALSKWNANGIGAYSGFGCIMLIYMIQNTTKIRYKVLYTGIAVFMLFITLNTGSRKALIAMIGIYGLYMMIKDRGTRWLRNMMILISIMFVFFVTIMTNEHLYQLIGARIIRMIQELGGTGTTERSMGERMKMIQDGIEYFKVRPWFGYGLACYAMMSIFETYSHCNYIELLVGIGLIGALLYYLIYVYAIKISWKHVFKKRDSRESFLFALVVILLINHMAIVSYYDITYNLMFILFLTYSELLNNKNRQLVWR